MVKIGAQFAKRFVRNEILVPHLNNWFANGEFPDEIPFVVKPNKEEDNAFHPSSALRCKRELYAMRREDLPSEGKHSPDLQKIFTIGHMYHGLLQWIIVEELGFSEWEQVEKEHDFGWDKEAEDYDGSLTTAAGNPYRIRGFLDVARCVVPNRGTYLVDIKTMNARIYAPSNLPGATQEKYEAQVKLYLEFEDLDEAILLAVEKDSPHRFKEILIQRDPDFIDEIMERWEDVVDAEAQGYVPECTCSNPGACAAKGIYQLDAA